jgi:AcrR family transcriptional regulator
VSDRRNTREQILDVAIDLFTEQGFDATSLREIAERIGITKAALYYHFPSKADILGTLADQMYEHIFEAPATQEVLRGGSTIEQWTSALHDMIDRLLDNARLFAMFERNHASLEQLASTEERYQKHDERQAQLQALMSDASVPLKVRVRLASSIGAVFFTASHALAVFHDVSTDELRASLHEVVDDLVASPKAVSTPRS